MNTNRIPNRLINEKSPYLLQHAYNPVSWFPWGDEAFAKAKAEDKPIFLSIGYSTCHWCHVMAHESFEDAEVAAALNRDFISIKVDREERPDIDAVYMAVCQALTGSGGWPLTILMTPDQKPFYAGTYLPKNSRYSMPGLLELLAGAAEQWHGSRERLLRSGNEIARAAQPRPGRGRAASSSENSIAAAYEQFARSFDPENGGFGRSPKFPTPHNLMFLLRYYKQEQEEHALVIAEKTLCQMARGGIFDQIGFGFSRYSTDEQWLVPHFEKMLYDNALLTIAYLEAYQITVNPFYRLVAERVLEYVQREMTNKDGGFCSAQDADSEGEEGKYYVFTPEELTGLLGEDDGAYFNSRFGITAEGNFEGRNIPNRLADQGSDIPDARLAALIPQVYRYRLARMELHRDDKVLTSWNALMIVAFSKAYQVLGKEEYLETARKAMEFLWNRLGDGSGSLFVRWRGGDVSGRGSLDDYAFTVWALLELYDADYRPGDLEKALLLNQKLLSDFWDGENGGFYLTEKGAEQLLFRPKEVYDGAVPSGNSVAGYCLTRLARLTGSAELEEAASRQLRFLSGSVQEYPAGYSFALMAQMAAVYPGTELVAIVGEEDDLKELKRMLWGRFLPNTVVLVIREQDREAIAHLAAFTGDYAMKDGKSTYYVCRNHACSAPTVSLAELEKSLS